MIKKTIKILKGRLNKIRFKKLTKNSTLSSSHFNSLTPSEDAENCEVYFEALEWALKNNHNIKNIALSGPFGSGKSSILQTFIKQYKGKNKGFWNWMLKSLFPKHFPKYRFLNLSLATFKHFNNSHQSIIEEEKSEAFVDDNKPNSSVGEIFDQPKNGGNTKIHNDKNISSDLKNDQDFQRLIELSILQQLFYHENDKKIPDSRFKKIKSHNDSKLLLYSIGCVIYLLSILYLFFPDFLDHFTLIKNIIKDIKYINTISSSIVLFGLFYLFYKLSRIFISFSINKLSISNAEIEIDKDISKSILNHHLDEIIYFFEVTNYNVVIIEDLDRFEQTEIFTKLRELNQLINLSNKIKRDIAFIYAIKEDMFTDKERVKFFDFIIPVIPIINFSNSEGKLRNIIGDSPYEIKPDLIDDLSLFIDDMRLLLNIMNEFYIYAEKITKGLDYNKLLAVIVYKNLSPNDYALLNENKGELFKNINSKEDFIKERIENINEEIERIITQISSIEEHMLIDIKELRIVYISKIIEKITNGFVGINKNDDKINISEFTSNEDFNSIKLGKIDYYFFNQRNQRNETTSFTFKFSEIEKEVNPKLNYQERENLILGRSKLNELKKQIEELKKSKEYIRRYSIQQLFEDGTIKIKGYNNPKALLIDLMLRNGYIDESYMEYISIFHEGALTKADKNFLINIKLEKDTNWDYKLNHIENLIPRITEFLFEKKYILNFDLVDELLKNTEFIKKRDILFKQLSNEQKYSIEFIDQYVVNGKKIPKFIEHLSKNWPNIWIFIKTKTNFTNKKIEEYFILIIKHAEIQDIKKNFVNDKSYLSNYSNFLNIEASGNRIQDIIKALDIKFETIDSNSHIDKIRFIYENNNYCLKIEIIRNILQHIEIYDNELFETKNYSYLHSPNLQKIADYIDINIEEYINSVFLQLKSNNNEDLEWYLKLLNNENLNIDLKEKIIIQTKTIVEKTDDVDDGEIWDLLFKHSKIQPRWENILEIYNLNENTLNDYVIGYLNQKNNAEQLAEEKIPSDEGSDRNNIYSKLCYEIIYNKKLNDESYFLLLQANPWWYSSLDIEKLAKERIELLIEAKIIEPSIEGYNFLKSNFNGANIQLLGLNQSKFSENINQLKFDIGDIELILSSKLFDDDKKIHFLKFGPTENIVNNYNILKSLSEMLVNMDYVDIDYTIIDKLINNSIQIDEKTRIILFTKYFHSRVSINIAMFLNLLSNEYRKIADYTHKAKIENTIENRRFLEKLVEFSYISSFSVKNKWLIVNHFRKNKKNQ